jgi:nickel-dependent lactate racemase
MPALIAEGARTRSITQDEKRALLQQLLAKLGGQPKRVLLLPPDVTRINSDAGNLCRLLYELLSPTAQVDLMPALGTHNPMSETEIHRMFGTGIPLDRFLVHDWRHALVRLGQVPGALVKEWSEGRLDYDIAVEVNERLLRGGYDLILSVGQVVPHEVVGMANYTKNVLVGVGGKDTINKSHFLGAAHGMERIMGRADTPVRRVFNWGFDQYLSQAPIAFILTVMEKEANGHQMHMRGFYAGRDATAFEQAARLSQQVNLNLLDRPMKKAVVYLDPHEFRSTWLGNKAVYRTRMAIADAGELLVLAPGLKEFGEDKEIHRLIRKYGYYGTPHTLRMVKENPELGDNLSAAAHLIHGASEGRFRIRYCPGPGMSLDEIRAVGYEAGDLEAMLRHYDPDKLNDGWNTLPDGEEIFFISNPGLGLWALREKFV